MANLQVSIQNPYIDVSDVPVQVEVRDDTLDLVDSTFVPFGGSTQFSVTPGMYVVEAELPSGQRRRQIVTVEEDGGGAVMVETSGLSPHEVHAWAYLNKSAIRAPEYSLEQAKYEGTWVRLWRHHGGAGWQVADSELGAGSTWDEDGVYYDLESFGGMQLLQVGGPQVPWKFVALPGAQRLRVLIRPADGPVDEVHPLDVIVSTHNDGAEAILSLLTSGAVDRAKAAENAGAAELMLYGKMADPAAAAIGGYYLLKIGDLDRLHDWTLNLANWIDWMADGPVIRAWHVLQDARLHGKDRAETRKIARDFFLEAVDRGVPVYTEGLRLLRDGINTLARDESDVAIQDARRIVSAYTQACDWTRPTTTFLGANPSEPSPEPVFGKPDSMQDLVFLFNVDTEELVRQGIVSVGSYLNLDRDDGEPVQVLVEKGGELNLDGKRYRNLQDIADSVGLPKTQRYQWRAADTGESISDDLSLLRHGKLAKFEK